MGQLINAQKVWYHGFNVSPKLRQLAESHTKAQLEASTLGDGAETFQPGLHGYGFSATGLWEGGDDNIDDELFKAESLDSFVLSVALTDGSVGSNVRALQAMQGSYTISGDHGQLLTIDMEAAAKSLPVRGSILHASEVSANTDGTALELGAITADQKLYGWLHVFGGSGALDVKIQSASDEAFTTPNDRITFTTVATGVARTSEWATPVDGAITDTWWRMTATVPGTRDFAVAMAIR